MICASDVTDDVDQSNCLVCLFSCVAASGEGLACFSYRGFDIEDGVHFAPAICNLEGTIELISGSFQYMSGFTKHCPEESVRLSAGLVYPSAM